jgi:hypothetical protein
MADSFSFGVEREMKESGEKGGTEDINIGVGELQEASVEPEPGELARTAGETQDYLQVKLENVQITSYQLGATEDGPAGPDDLGADTPDSAESRVSLSEIHITKVNDKASPAMFDEDDDDEGSTLETLEVQAPAAIGRAIGSVAAEGAEEPDLDDLDLDDDDGDLDV